MLDDHLLTIRRRLWRILAPKWASEPLSGQGAALRGGRWNPRGTPALYFSESHGTAIAEYNQDLVRPGTLAAFDLVSEKIVDLCSTETQAKYGLGEKEMLAPWKTLRGTPLLSSEARLTLAVFGKFSPPGWRLAEELMELGIDGIRVPSAKFSGTNIVIWRWNGGTGTTVSVVDPLGDLPRDQSSW